MKIAVIGMGLIGASLSRAILKNTEHEVYGFDIDAAVLKRADELGAHTRALCEDDYKNIDLAIFALCPDTAIKQMKSVCPKLKDGAIVADTCGNKRVIMRDMCALKKQYPALNFVGTHPMAGKERGGIENSTSELFQGAYVILVPANGNISEEEYYSADENSTAYDDNSAIGVVRKLYLSIGAKGIEICSAERHDEMIAYTSQLAHVVSSCYVQNPRSKSHVGFSAGSFADLTRVARLNPDMWTELFLQNKDNLVDCIDDISARLENIKSALTDGDGERLKAILAYGTDCKEIADGKKEKK
ncbi:MAG: prephenate dehydrogenase [Clostridia bacterium]|nr:prephenate dehydrogenase [Clostridia bacterium]